MPDDSYKKGLTDEQIRTHFPLKRPDPQDGVFEFGLVLGGTVSAGAYTAGVLDFLVQALDEWAAAKAAGKPNIPKHDVTLSAIAGTSGGAVNGAMLLRLLGRNDPRGADPGNPFYTTWTNGLGFAELLSVDGDSSPPLSLLNATALKAKADNIVNLPGGAASETRRTYLADPLRLIMMVGNITGLPYTMNFSGASGLRHAMSAHMDHMRFALAVRGGAKAEPASREDELAIAGDDTQRTNWPALAAAALASCAFPLALPTRPIRRALPVAGFRAVVLPGTDSEPARVRQLLPDWSTLSFGEQPDDVTNFINVDGGTFNNEPFDMVRTALAGLAGRNERAGDKANRAVILVDPFSDPGGIDAKDRVVKGPFEMIGPLAGALIAQGRFKPVDLVLADDEQTFSRFLVAPVGPELNNVESVTVGSKAIASGGLSGFLGFLDRRFLDYDFRLGRRNAQRFLQKHFMFPDTNPIMAKGYAGLNTAPYRDGKFLQMIPLVGSAAVEIPAPALVPQLPGLPDGFDAALRRRLDHIFETLIVKGSGAGFGARLYLKMGWSLGGRSALIDAVKKMLIEALQGQKLMPKT